MNKKLKLFVCITLVISIMLSLTAVSFATDEAEPANNSMSTPTRIYDDTNNYGYISSTTDVDWWVISFGNNEGFVNFYLGSIPTSCNYNMHIYKSDGTLIASSTNQLYYNELFRIRVYKNTDYYIKIVTVSGTSTTDSYKLRCKVYALKPTRVFTVDYNNVWRDNCPALYTKQDAEVIIPSLWSMGYTATEYCNNSANAALTVYPNSDIMIISSHGNYGRMYFNNQTLYASLDTFTDDGYNEVKNEMKDLNREISANGLSELDLAIYACCKTGGSEPYGSLIDITLEKGAYACIGWNDTIRNGPINSWFDKLFDELATGKTVAIAMGIADNYIQYDLAINGYDAILNREIGSSRLDRLILGGY